jgi:hypothetical protein
LLTDFFGPTDLSGLFCFDPKRRFVSRNMISNFLNDKWVGLGILHA